MSIHRFRSRVLQGKDKQHLYIFVSLKYAIKAKISVKIKLHIGYSYLAFLGKTQSSAKNSYHAPSFSSRKMEATKRKQGKHIFPPSPEAIVLSQVFHKDPEMCPSTSKNGDIGQLV